MKINKNTKVIIFIFLLALITLFVINNFYTKQTLVGKYVNRNFENTLIGENPHIEDTLELFSNNEFSSPYYGKGKYKLSYGIDGTYIKLNYKDETGKTSFETSIYKPLFFGKPRIILFDDLNQYYEKIDEITPTARIYPTTDSALRIDKVKRE